MDKNFFFAMIFIFSAVLKNSNGSILRFVDVIEEGIIRSLVTNCTEGKEITLQDYDRLKYLAALKMQSAFLKHYRGNEEDIYFLLNERESIAASPKYNRSLPMVILIHGYLGTFYPFNYMEIARALYDTKTVNVFIMDNTVLMTDSYYAASTHTQFIGEALGRMLSELYKSGIRNFHLIGHSLGAHISGITGKIFEAETGKKLNRISALDPAGPCYIYEGKKRRLSLTDADFVDVMHSDINTYGIGLSLGHVDFYPNSGENMPGCITSVCSHLKIGFYYAESVYNDQFLAVKCPDWNTFITGDCFNNSKVHMGYWTPTSTRGNYFLTTNIFPKFAKGINGIIPPLRLFNFLNFLNI